MTSRVETCCGFGGTFAAKFPMISTAMGEGKCDSALETGAEYVVSNDSSCLMHLQGLLDRQRYGAEFPSFISLITGPSRTGDIERILVLGAHGPKQLTVFCL